MTPTNVVSMNFKTASAMQEFIDVYEKDAPSLYPQAELLLLVKIDDASLIAVAAYPSEEGRLAAKKTAEERIEGHLAPLFKENFRLVGDMVVKHQIKQPS